MYICTYIDLSRYPAFHERGARESSRARFINSAYRDSDLDVTCVSASHSRGGVGGGGGLSSACVPQKFSLWPCANANGSSSSPWIVRPRPRAGEHGGRGGERERGGGRGTERGTPTLLSIQRRAYLLNRRTRARTGKLFESSNYRLRRASIVRRVREKRTRTRGVTKPWPGRGGGGGG